MKKFSKPFFEKRGGFFSTTKNGLVDESDVVHDSPEPSEAGWVRAQLGKIAKIRFKEFVKSTNHTCACNGLTNFEFEAPKILQKQDPKNS